MWRYLDLINRTSVLIEDLFLLLLTGLGYNRPNDKTIFKQVAWQAFRNLILKDSAIRLIFSEVGQWRDSGHAVGDPGAYLDQI